LHIPPYPKDIAAACETTKLQKLHKFTNAVRKKHDTINLVERDTPASISPDLWPPNSPDLNPVDYKIWGVM